MKCKWDLWATGWLEIKGFVKSTQSPQQQMQVADLRCTLVDTATFMVTRPLGTFISVSLRACPEGSLHLYHRVFEFSARSHPAITHSNNSFSPWITFSLAEQLYAYTIYDAVIGKFLDSTSIKFTTARTLM